MTKIDKAKSRIYYERAVDCVNALISLSVIKNDNANIYPEYLRGFRLRHNDVLFIMHSIAAISFINAITIKLLGKKGKDHRDMSYFKQAAEMNQKLHGFLNFISGINAAKNKSEYGDEHFYTENYNLNKLVLLKNITEEILSIY